MEREKYPVLISSSISDPPNAGEEIKIVIEPNQFERDKKGYRKENRYLKGYEYPITVLHETLTPLSVNKLWIALDIIKKQLKLDSKEAMGCMINAVIFSIDVLRQDKRKPSILMNMTPAMFEQLEVEEKKRFEENIYKPLLSLDLLLEFWGKVDSQVLSIFDIKNPDQIPGRFNFNHIPPAWVSYRDLNKSELFPDPEKESAIYEKNNIYVKTFNYMDTLYGIYKELAPMMFDLVNKNLPKIDFDKQTKVQTQTKEFAHSPDFRSVTLKGQTFTLTPAQARIIDILYQNYENGTPVVSQAHLLEESDSTSKRLRDIFKDSSAWKNLVASGEKRGTYRLNI